VPEAVADGLAGTNICPRIEPLPLRRFAQSYMGPDAVHHVAAGVCKTMRA